MFSPVHLAAKYLRYYLTASNGKGHGMHSPFVFDFINHVLCNKKGYDPGPSIEALRDALKKDNSLLSIEDLGAGSRTHAQKERTIAQVTRTAVKPKKYSRLLYRLVRHYQPQQVIELGTSLGISTAYMASANPDGRVTTIEGSKAVYQLALQHFRELQLSNITTLHGNFDTSLPQVMAPLHHVDLAFVDGNHRLEPTLRYFEQILEKCAEGSILIFDDIHWSPEMEKAWKTIQQHPSVRCTIDLFFLGFVFFSSSFKVRQHFVIRY